jgi:hypothetical protein
MMPIGDIPALYDAVWKKDLFLIKEKKCKFASQLYLRHLCNTSDVDEVEEQIQKYALYRYGGKLKLDKQNFDVEYVPGVYSESFHPTYNELMDRIDVLMQDEKKAPIMKSLKEFYQSSVINTIAGKDLSEIVRVKTDEKDA